MPTTKSWPSTTFRREASRRFPRVRGWFRDLLDVEILNCTLSEGFDGVLHLATLSLVGESVEHPGLYYRTNVCGMLNLLDAMRAARVSRLIFSSTAAVYGQPEEVPVEKTAPPTPPTRTGPPSPPRTR